jgi:hypothetical protein
MGKDLNSAIHPHIQGLEKKFGKPVQYWIELVQSWNEPKHMTNVNRLKEEFGLGHGHAGMVVHLAKENTSAHMNEEELDESIFKGKEHWKPLHERLEALVAEVSTAIELSPKKKYVSLRTNRQIGALCPATKTRYEVQFNLKGVTPSGRLESMKPGGMCTHFIALSAESDDLSEVKIWLERAFESAQ